MSGGALIRDITGKLSPLLELIAEIPECRKITADQRFHDEQIEIRIFFEIEGKLLVCALRDYPDAFLEKYEEILASVQQNIEAWRYIGPPYKVIATDNEYKALFTLEQKQKMKEVF